MARRIRALHDYAPTGEGQIGLKASVTMWGLFNIFCCWGGLFCGIAAMIQACTAASAMNASQYNSAIASAKCCNIAGSVVGPILIIVLIVVLTAGAAAATAGAYSYSSSTCTYNWMSTDDC